MRRKELLSLRASIRFRLMLGFRRLPVSWILLLVCALLHGSFIYLSLFPQEQSLDGTHVGSLRHLVRTDHPEVHGFFQLWEGQWWRLPVSALHHADLLHLCSNAVMFWIFGGMLEPKLGRVRYLFFLLSALMVSLMPEAFVEKQAVGISGLVYAMFGLLLVLRTQDETIRERFYPSLIVLGFAWLFLCIPLTMLEIMPIANGGHLCGIVYGALVGWLSCIVLPRYRLIGWLSVVGLHVVAVVGIATLMAPVWNGRYWGWRAITENRPEFWLQAVQRDPRMVTGWVAMIDDQRGSGDSTGAWETALQAAQAHRSSTFFDEIIRELFRDEFRSTAEQNKALDSLRTTFGDEADAWLGRLHLPQFPVIEGDSFEELVELPPLDLPSEMFDSFTGLTQHVPGITVPHEIPPRRPTVDPDDPRSARYGEVL